MGGAAASDGEVRGGAPGFEGLKLDTRRTRPFFYWMERSQATT